MTITDFLPAILRAPEDDLPRLVAADAIEEAGDVEWAELIRAEVARKLLHRSAWDRLMRRTIPIHSCVVTTDRGFAYEIKCGMDDWMKHGETICRHHPITQVTIDDRIPWREIHYLEDRVWWAESLYPMQASFAADLIPDEIISIMREFCGPQQWWDFVRHANLDEANKALSRACLLYGRRKAGIPDLITTEVTT